MVSAIRPCVLLFTMLFFSFTAQSQYFGRNKVLYRNFDFKVSQTPHFEIYQYLNRNDVKNQFARSTEQWYLMHQRIFRDTFKQRNPLILYNHHAHFQQTRAIEGEISVGTGGVTEGLKNRVVMPFFESNAQTDHVLGHELVHAFQYHLIGDSLSLNALNNLPLWMIEGLAEYMSTGYEDANTAMWLRSALLQNKLPTLKDLTNKPNEYFPYRWGEAFWAFLTARYGDQVIRPFFMESARRGYAEAIKTMFKLDEKQLSQQWQEAIRIAYGPLQAGTQAQASGRQVIGRSNGGRMNIVPSLSPDGQHIAYWTEKNLFSIDLYVADAQNGEHANRITRNSSNAHIDQYSSYESSVAWSPDSKRLAFVAFAKGKNRLIIASTEGKILEEMDIPGLDGFSNPAWSPDGNTIVMTGLTEGQSDLYAWNLSTRSVRQLTKDRFADLQPSFSPDGKTIVFATDRLSLGNQSTPHQFAHNLALIDLNSTTITNLDIFPGANNLNPVYGDNNVIYFLSDRDGFRNLYSYDLSTGSLQQRTSFFTGISGITMYAPAISMARSTNTVAYSFYQDNDYIIYTAPLSALTPKEVQSHAVNTQAALLPPFNRTGQDLVQQGLRHLPDLSAAQVNVKELPYDPRFGLDYIGNTGVGIQTGGGYGTGLAGGVNGIFSDILGDHQLYGALSLNGELVDVGGQFAYFNQKSRFNWGASLSHIPYLSGAQYLFYDSVKTNAGDTARVINSALDLLRTFQDQVAVFASYPFSTIRRIEAGASFARYYYRLDRYSNYYDPVTEYYLGSSREKQDVPSGFNFANTYLALVGDNSFFGVTSPLAGHRFRLEASQYLGVVNLQNYTADYRKYFRLAPVTLATRNMFVGRYGRDAESGVLPPLYLGYPFLVRGYDALDYTGQGNRQLTINDLIGSRIYVGNVELRLPFTGPERLSVIRSRFLFTDLNLFTDAGVAWGKQQSITGSVKEPAVINRTSRLIMSSGISLRLNLFGYLILEPYYAIPWQNGGWKNGSFGFNFTPGW